MIEKRRAADNVQQNLKPMLPAEKSERLMNALARRVNRNEHRAQFVAARLPGSRNDRMPEAFSFL